jgi:hypothetical protein
VLESVPSIVVDPSAIATSEITKHAAPVMHQQPRPGQRGRQPVVQTDPVGEHPQRRRASVLHEILPITGNHQIPRPRGKLAHRKVLLELGRSRSSEHSHSPRSGGFFRVIATQVIQDQDKGEANNLLPPITSACAPATRTPIKNGPMDGERPCGSKLRAGPTTRSMRTCATS